MIAIASSTPAGEAAAQTIRRDGTGQGPGGRRELCCAPSRSRIACSSDAIVPSFATTSIVASAKRISPGGMWSLKLRPVTSPFNEPPT